MLDFKRLDVANEDDDTISISFVALGASGVSVDVVSRSCMCSLLSRGGVVSLVVAPFGGDDDSGVDEDGIDGVVGESHVELVVVSVIPGGFGIRGDLEAVIFGLKKSDIFCFFDDIISITI